MVRHQVVCPRVSNAEAIYIDALVDIHKIKQAFVRLGSGSVGEETMRLMTFMTVRAEVSSAGGRECADCETDVERMMLVALHKGRLDA